MNLSEIKMPDVKGWANRFSESTVHPFKLPRSPRVRDFMDIGFVEAYAGWIVTEAERRPLEGVHVYQMLERDPLRLGARRIDVLDSRQLDELKGFLDTLVTLQTYNPDPERILNFFRRGVTIVYE